MLPGQSKIDIWSISIVGLRGVIRGEAVRNGAGFGRVSTNLSCRLGFSRYSFII